MRIIYLLFLLLIVENQLFAAENDTILWSNSRLVIGDFRMKKVSQALSESHKANYRMTLEGYIFTGINFSYIQNGNSLICEVSAYMVPNESWIRAAEDAATLEHEQAHFDITEIYARRLRSQLAHVKNVLTAKKLMRTNFEDLQAEQRRFDKDNLDENGVLPVWKIKIKNELSALEQWSAPIIKTEIH